MQYRELGKTGERVSILGFGTMRLPVLGGDEARIDEPEATRMLNRAIELGVNYVDTAWPYHMRTSEPWDGSLTLTAFNRPQPGSESLPNTPGGIRTRGVSSTAL